MDDPSIYHRLTSTSQVSSSWVLPPAEPICKSNSYRSQLREEFSMEKSLQCCSPLFSQWNKLSSSHRTNAIAAKLTSWRTAIVVFKWTVTHCWFLFCSCLMKLSVCIVSFSLDAMNIDFQVTTTQFYVTGAQTLISDSIRWMYRQECEESCFFGLWVHVFPLRNLNYCCKSGK